MGSFASVGNVRYQVWLDAFVCNLVVLLHAHCADGVPTNDGPKETEVPDLQ